MTRTLSSTRRYRCFCPADSLLTGEKDDHECQYGEPMCWENDHRLLPTNTESQEHHRLYACICSDMMRYGIFGIEKTTSLVNSVNRSR